MINNQKFMELLGETLKRQGYSCTRDGDEIKVNKDGFPVADILGNGEFRVYRNTMHDYDRDRIRAIYESISEAYALYEKGAPLKIDNLSKYHKLCEFGNYIIAAKIMSNCSMEFVTWQQDAERTRVDIGHYFTDYEHAKQDFAVRTGLIDRYKMFDETELKLIRQGLVHLGADYPHLTAQQMANVGKMIKRIEMIVPAVREHEQLEHQALVPDDGLEI